MAAAAFDLFVNGLRDTTSPILSPQRVADALHIESQELAALAGVHRNTLRVSPGAPRLQASMRDILRVMSAAQGLGRTPDDIVFWLHNHPIAALRHRTAFDLIKDGKAQAVVDYLVSVESGYVG